MEKRYKAAGLVKRREAAPMVSWDQLLLFVSVLCAVVAIAKSDNKK